jgi:hypothetical protein
MKLVKETKSKRYFVTRKGVIFSETKSSGKWRILKAKGSPYCRVNIDGETLYVHRIVAEAYLPNTSNCNEVNHKDLDKTNNEVSNLEWCSRQHNQEHALAKEWKVITPDGSVVSFDNLSQFCRENNLTIPVMYEMFREGGRYKSHKGFRPYKESYVQ